MRDKLKLIQESMDRAVKNKEVAGVNLLVIQDGKEVYYAQSGHSDISANRPMNRDTIVHLYSQSKPVTAAAAMLLMQDGIIDLNEPVGNFIDSFKDQSYVTPDGKISKLPWDKSVRIVDLLNMTSGLVYPGINTPAECTTTMLFDDAIQRLKYPYDKPACVEESELKDKHGHKKYQMSTMEFAEEIGKLPLQFIPGSFFQYGTSADVLGAVIEKVSGMKFSEFLKERIFDPLEMKDTDFYVPEEKKSRFSQVYEVVNGEFKEFGGDHLIIRHDGNKNAFESGGAGLFSTLDDYSHFGQMLLNGGTYNGKEILTPETVRFMTCSAVMEGPQHAFDNWHGLEGHTYSNLMRILVSPEKALIIGNKGEYGWDGWLGAYFMNDPASKTTLLMMTQMRDYGTGYLTRRLRNIVMS
ncbi:serine hydrolase domain-containing protein [Butyrivibrio sp. YAB3001]|uniref:serine hydrolase domain-containing protein n=1 Tax=Butyrivibrio sp. YAB3001 TaxID=1520812 RepID=UPI0008F68AD3|nr:serine hydrolase domain-containing protein [Butyrivibrio sp. YAB3001]SFB97754.1 CubicO group peptidase, beta-lactamase class C family [Butyrivibrio sp. YAB3001]